MLLDILYSRGRRRRDHLPLPGRTAILPVAPLFNARAQEYGDGAVARGSRDAALGPGARGGGGINVLGHFVGWCDVADPNGNGASGDGDGGNNGGGWGARGRRSPRGTVLLSLRRVRHESLE